MTTEEKQLLLKDLCTRLPYGVIVEITSWGGMMGVSYNMTLDLELLNDLIENDDDDFKPYLRPLSSMNDKEQKEFAQFHCVKLCPIIVDRCLTIANESKMIDWLNSHYFDYRGLIEKGLALEASEGMYKGK